MRVKPDVPRSGRARLLLLPQARATSRIGVRRISPL
jgi:hypothetical protein